MFDTAREARSYFPLFAALWAGASSDAPAFFVSSPMGFHPADEVALQVPVGHALKSMTGCSSHTEARQQRGFVGSTPQSWPATKCSLSTMSWPSTLTCCPRTALTAFTVHS